MNPNSALPIISGYEELLKRSLYVGTINSFSINLKRLASEIEEISSHYKTKVSSRGTAKLSSLSFTHRPDASDPFYDGNNSQFNPETNERLYDESDFSEFNEEFKGSYVHEIYKQLPFQTGRFRILTLAPGKTYPMHLDGTLRAHIPITTNDDCLMMFKGRHLFHLPVGQLHIANTRDYEHTAFNCGHDERVHLVMSIAGTEI